MSGRLVALLGDTSDHGGTITSSNQDGTVTAEGKQVCVDGAILNCPIPGHGPNSINSNLDNDWEINGKKVVLDGSKASCGASIISSATRTFGK